jgi:protein-S-isoprenylcysteine O-methyltransferase Ste14
MSEKEREHKKWLKNPRVIVNGILITLATLGQVVLAILLYNRNGITALINVGWAVLWIAGIIGCIPIFMFHKWGGVPKGKGYMETTKVVDKGIYAFIRHPQYLAGILISMALPLVSQHWAVAMLGVIAAILYYIGMFDEESACKKKFGKAYSEYMQRVPRANFLLGVVRLLFRKKESKSS